MEDVRCICGGSKAILSKLLSVDTLLCGGGGDGREDRGAAFQNFLRDVNSILNPTATEAATMPPSAATVSVTESDCETVSCYDDSDCGPDCFCPQLRDPYPLCRKKPTPKPSRCTVSCGGYCGGDNYRQCGENCKCYGAYYIFVYYSTFYSIL